MTSNAPEPRQTQPATVPQYRDDRHADADAAAYRQDGLAREDVLAREKERFGGFKFGSAFFGTRTVVTVAIGFPMESVVL